jgi:hypothetical protein
MPGRNGCRACGKTINYNHKDTEAYKNKGALAAMAVKAPFIIFFSVPSVSLW